MGRTLKIKMRSFERRKEEGSGHVLGRWEMVIGRQDLLFSRWNKIVSASTIILAMKSEGNADTRSVRFVRSSCRVKAKLMS